MLACAAQEVQQSRVSLGSQIADGLAPLVDLVYPPRCALCGTGVDRQGGLCITCWSELIIPSEPSCASCSRPIRSGKVESICAPCMQHPPAHSGIAAATIYSEPSRKLILAFKHGGKIGLAPHLARLIDARLLEKDKSSERTLIVPVPLHRWRLWKRGYNQAALLASELAKLGRGKLVVDGLVRSKPTPTLGGLGRRARERTLKGAITVNPRRAELLQSRDVILVDDVLTSGATTDACVKALLKAGAHSVRIACFARVLEEEMEPGLVMSALESETPEA